MLTYTKQSTKASEIDAIHRQLVAGAANHGISFRIIRECSHYEFRKADLSEIVNLITGERYSLSSFTEIHEYPESVPQSVQSEREPGIVVVEEDASPIEVLVIDDSPLEVKDIILGLGLLRVACESGN